MKKTIIATLMTLICAALFAQNAASDFEINANGTITKYKGWGTTVVIPETINGIQVRAIGEDAFASNDLTSVTILRSVTTIGNSAFSRNKLTRVTIPDSVTSIGYGAFSQNQLTSVTIPGNGVTIDGRVFYDNPITSVTLGSNHVFGADIVPRVNGESSLFYDYVCNDRKAGTYTANRAVAAVKTEADFRYIGTQYGAFITGYTGSSQNRLEITARLGGLSVKAISGFRGITRVRIPDSVTYISNNAFTTYQGDPISLTEITIPNSVTYLSGFSGNVLTSVTIPNSVTTIGDEAFFRCRLGSVTIPDSVTYIGKDAFCENQLTNVTIGNSVTYIGDRAFGAYQSSSSPRNRLTRVTIPNSVTRIGKNAFSHNRLTEITIPNSVISIGEGAFLGNDLTSVTIGSNVADTVIGAISSSLRDVYNANGKAAGTYNYSGGKWTKQ